MLCRHVDVEGRTSCMTRGITILFFVLVCRPTHLLIGVLLSLLLRICDFYILVVER